MNTRKSLLKVLPTETGRWNQGQLLEQVGFKHRLAIQTKQSSQTKRSTTQGKLEIAEPLTQSDTTDNLAENNASGAGIHTLRLIEKFGSGVQVSRDG